MFGIFKKIRDLITTGEEEVFRLKTKRTKLQEALAILDDLVIKPDGSYAVGTWVSRARLSDYDIDLIDFFREGIGSVIRELNNQIENIELVLQRLKIKLHYFKRNLRSCIRQMQHFFFKNLDDMHITFSYTTYKMQMIK